MNNDANQNVGVIEAAPPESTVAPPIPTARQPSVSTHTSTWLSRVIPMTLALSCVAGVVALGYWNGWKLPKFSTVVGQSGPETDDWCETHSVPESICIECRKEFLPPAPERGWCRIHGVHECPHCHPTVAQTPFPPEVSEADRERAARALTFVPRVENNSKCKLHQRRIQITSTGVIDRLGIQVTPAIVAPVTESVTAPAQIVYDPTAVARLSSRVSGTVWRVEKQVGDKVRRGDVLAVVDAAEVGKLKGEFQQALVQLELRRQTLAGLRSSVGSVAAKNVQEAEAAIEETQVRLVTAEQALLNLDLPVQLAEVQSLAPAELIRRMQFLGLPAALAQEFAGRTTSSNLIAVKSPLDGEVVERSAFVDGVTGPNNVMFVIADTSRLKLDLRVCLEDAGRIKPGQEVRFQHAGHAGSDQGTVLWISPAVEEKTRQVSVRVEFPNPSGLHHVNTFGTAQVILRIEPYGTLVPSSAVHWEGDCNVVFVRDKNFETTDGPKVFHVRKVRPGAQEMTAGGRMTEIIAGLLPGEWVATANSGTFRTELLKNNLGAG